MNLSRLKKLSKFNRTIKQKISWTVFLFIGILSLCLGQNSITFKDELKAAGTTESEKTKKKFYKTLRLLQQKYQNHLDTNCNDNADLYRNLGVHFYNNKDRIKALSYYEDTALQIAINCPSIDFELITQIYLNVLGTKIILDQKQNLSSIIDKLIWHLEENKAGSIEHQAKIQSEISRYYDEIGDFDQSMLWIQSSIANYHKSPLSEKKLRAYLEWAYILFGAEDYRKAIAVFDSTRLLAQKLDVLDDPIYNEYIFYNKAACFIPIGEYQQALKYTQLYASMTNPNDPAVLSDITNLKAFVFFDEKKYNTALKEMDKSIQLANDSKDEYLQLRIVKDYLFISKIHLLQENFPAAAHAAALAIERSIVPKPNWQKSISNFSKLFVKNPNGFNKAATSYFKAIVHYESEENILSFADQLDSTFFSLQTYYSGEESKAEITVRHHDFCDVLLQYIFENQLENKYPNLAAYYISNSKALALLEKLAIKKGLPEELKTEFEALNEQWNETYSALEVQESLENAAMIDSLAKVNFDLNLRRDKLDARLAALDLVPNFRKSRSSIIQEAQSKLKAGEALVDFFYGQEKLYAWYMDGDQVIFKSDKIHPFLAQDFVPSFSSTEMKQLQAYDKNLEAISTYFAPFFEQLDSEIEQLTIIPDGKLLYFPFEVLTLKDKPLMDQASIHYLFSNSIKEFARKKVAQGVQPYVGFAMQYDEQILQDIAQSKEILKLYKDSFALSELPYGLEEVKLAQGIFSGTSFLDEACTQASFFEAAAKGQILHIANHALLNENNSFLSSIVFAKEGAADLVNVIDIKKLSLNADLAILSSCNSGRGENIAGSGLRSLGLSFAEAGCPAVLVNLWEASDKSTKQIIEVFSQYLKEGLPKSQALQKAKQEYIQSVPRELQHPKYWASLVLIGDDSPIDFGSSASAPWWIYLVFGLMVAIVAGGLRRYKKRTV